MKRPTKLLWLTAVLIAIACSDAPVVGPEATGDEVTIETMRWYGLWSEPVKVLSRNLYIGFDVDELIDSLATGRDLAIQAALQKALTTFAATDFPTRAAAIAREIDLLRPDAVGLQEVTFLDVDIPGLADFELSFLPILQAKLAERQLNYVVAAQIQTTNAQLPGITFQDGDAMLVNADRVTVLGSDAQLFTNNLHDPLGIGIDILRGWTMIHARIHGREVEIWNSHLESGPEAQIVGLRGLQAAELAGMASTEMPVILMGDLNDQVGSPMYQALTAAGFDNAWQKLRPWLPGHTCCHAPELWNWFPHFDERIDHVFVRGLPYVKGAVLRTGMWPWEKVQGPAYKLWPSDHAGLYAALTIPSALVVDD
jgi:endonuclease/exonuclease/phosphatase family metal-dependent hydrolase